MSQGCGEDQARGDSLHPAVSRVAPSQHTKRRGSTVDGLQVQDLRFDPSPPYGGLCPPSPGQRVSPDAERSARWDESVIPLESH